MRIDSRVGKLTFCIKARVPRGDGNFLLQRSSSLKFELVLKGETHKKITEKAGSILRKVDRSRALRAIHHELRTALRRNASCKIYQPTDNIP